MTFELTIFISLMISIGIYLVSVLLSKVPEDFDGFHFAKQTLSLTDFYESTFMYGLQIAVLALFAAWGYAHGLFSLVVPVFWFLGYWLIARLATAGRLDDFLSTTQLKTIHHFIADKSHLKTVAILAALVSLLGISGPAMYEVSVVSHAIDETAITDRQLYVVLFGLLVVVSAVYMSWGGMRGVVKTDRLQFVAGYFCFGGVFAFLLYQLADRITPQDAVAIGMLALCVTLAIAMIKTHIAHRLVKTDIADEHHCAISPYMAWHAFLIPAMFVIALVMIFWKQPEAINPVTALWGFVSNEFGSPFPWIAFISLLIANGLYQLVDVGHWQRILSLKIDKSEIIVARSVVADASLSAGGSSALSWIMAILFGVMVRKILPEADPYTALVAVSQLFKANFDLLYWNIATLAWFIALAAVMFSTLDSLMAGVAVTVHNDLVGKEGNSRFEVLKARLLTVALLIAAYFIYLWLEFASGGDPSAILYLCWSFQIALAPAILASFISPMPGWAIILSIVAGCTAALEPFLTGTPGEVFNRSPLWALLASSAVLIALKAGNKKVTPT
tara:strand:+ start:511 stop:2187 length:1677 start_codon:yes stop_codon:yes gene_type:complete